MAHQHRESSSKLDREADAWNAAFDELELDCRWNGSILAELADIADESERITVYLRRHRPHLLKAYPAEFLAQAISGTKARLEAER
jgi:hypothetical protein